MNIDWTKTTPTRITGNDDHVLSLREELASALTHGVGAAAALAGGAP